MAKKDRPRYGGETNRKTIQQISDEFEFNESFVNGTAASMTEELSSFRETIDGVDYFSSEGERIIKTATCRSALTILSKEREEYVSAQKLDRNLNQKPAAWLAFAIMPAGFLLMVFLGICLQEDIFFAGASMFLIIDGVMFWLFLRSTRRIKDFTKSIEAVDEDIALISEILSDECRYWAALCEEE